MNNSSELTPSGNSQLPVIKENNQIINLDEHRTKRNHGGKGSVANPKVLRPAIENALQEEEQNVVANELNEKQKEEALARKQIVEARLNEIRPNGIILNANDSEEYAELQKELHSLDKRIDEHKKPEAKKEQQPEKTPEERIAVLETENKELKEKIDVLLAKTNENLEASGGTPETRAKKLGIDSFEQIVSAIGEKWSKFPSKYKYAVSAALIIGGTATAMTGAPILAGAFTSTAVGLRALGGASMYFGIKKFLNTYQEGKLKGGEKLEVHREDLNKMTAAAVALALAVALPGFLQQEFQNAEAHISEFLNPEEALAFETPETAINALAEVATETQTTLVPTEKIAELATVKPDQGFWQPIYNQLAEANPEWSKAELNAETHKLLLQNNIINPDGTELRVQPGEQIVLNKDNTITFNKEGAYSFKEPVIETPVAEPQIEQSAVAIEQPVAQIVIDEVALSKNTDMYVRNYINEMFGGKGFFGFGATSPDAIDKIKDWGGHFGFSNHTISEIVNHEEGPMIVESNNRYGINNPTALEKMQQAITQVAQETGVQPIPSEKSEEYFRRAVFTSLKNSVLKGQ